MAKTELLVSALALLHNDVGVLAGFMEEVSRVLDEHYANYEIILIDNGSVDGTEKAVGSLLKERKCVRYLRLARPTDDETALVAGLDAAIGDYLAILSPDLDPPAELVKMVDLCRTNGNLVMGVDCEPSQRGFVYRMYRNAFLAASRRLLRLDLSVETTGYRVLSRQAANALAKVRLRRRYFAVVAAEVGQALTYYPYHRISRSGRGPVRHLLQDMRFGMTILVHNSITLLRFASGLGVFASFLSFCYTLYAVLIFLFYRKQPQGWTTLSLALSVMFGIAFLILALLGEYLSRVLEESSDRPLYHVRDEQSSAILLGDQGRPNVLDRTEEETAAHQASG